MFSSSSNNIQNRTGPKRPKHVIHDIRDIDTWYRYRRGTIQLSVRATHNTVCKSYNPTRRAPPMQGLHACNRCLWKNTPFRQAFDLQSFGRNCSPAPDIGVSRANFPKGLPLRRNVLFHRRRNVQHSSATCCACCAKPLAPGGPGRGCPRGGGDLGILYCCACVYFVLLIFIISLKHLGILYYTIIYYNRLYYSRLSILKHTMTYYTALHCTLLDYTMWYGGEGRCGNQVALPRWHRPRVYHVIVYYNIRYHITWHDMTWYYII